MTPLVDRALRLWSEPLPEGDAAVAAFRTVYTDPLDVNGAATALQVLVDRARMLQRALEGIDVHIKERFEAPGRQAFAFRITGHHVGPLETPLGEIAAAGRVLTLDGIDIFLVDDDGDRVTGVWAIADFLDVLIQAGVLDRSALPAT
jgi:SnoaL-like polyketide cyclase